MGSPVLKFTSTTKKPIKPTLQVLKIEKYTKQKLFGINKTHVNYSVACLLLHLTPQITHLVSVFRA